MDWLQTGPPEKRARALARIALSQTTFAPCQTRDQECA